MANHQPITSPSMRTRSSHRSNEKPPPCSRSFICLAPCASIRPRCTNDACRRRRQSACADAVAASRDRWRGESACPMAGRDKPPRRRGTPPQTRHRRRNENENERERACSGLIRHDGAANIVAAAQALTCTLSNPAAPGLSTQAALDDPPRCRTSMPAKPAFTRRRGVPEPYSCTIQITH